ncbi:MAG: hypothetical protein R3C68_14675 [Myxococcota bacterium]
MSPAQLKVVHGSPRKDGPMPRERKLLWISMVIGLLFAGVAFCYKIAEFIYTMTSDDAKGFADVPITVYFVVASGWLFLLLWCFVTGKFTNHGRAKFEMLAQEEEYERLGW